MRRLVAGVVLAVVVGVLRAGAAESPRSLDVQASIAPTSLSLSTGSLPGFIRARLTIAGPDGYFLKRTFVMGETIGADLSKVRDAQGEEVRYPDGKYTWELLVFTPKEHRFTLRAEPDPNSVAQSPEELDGTAWMAAGRFVVSGGTLRSEPGVDGLLTMGPDRTFARTGATPGGAGDIVVSAQTTNTGGNYFSGDVNVGGGLCTGCADGTSVSNGTVTLSSSVPQVKFDDTTDSQVWLLGPPVASSWFTLRDETNSAYPLVVEDAAPSYAIHVDGQGNVGLGTATIPTDTRFVVGSKSIAPKVGLATGGVNQYQFYYGASGFWLGADSGAGTFYSLKVNAQAPENTLSLGSSGNVGLGVFSPLERLHVVGAAGTDMKVRLDGPGGQQVETVFYDSTARAGRLIASLGNTLGNRYFGFLAYRDKDNVALPVRFFTTDAGGGLQDTLYLGANQNAGQPGNVGIGVVAPAYPLQMKSGAHVTAGGVWTNASSRDYKEDISDLSGDAADQVLDGLTPVSFTYKGTDGERHVGFIAEDVPELVATPDRKGLSSMDVVAVLTKVVQSQKKLIEEQQAALAALQARVKALESR